MANKVGQGLEFCGQLTIFRTEDWRGYVNSVEDLRPGWCARRQISRCEGACRR